MVNISEKLVMMTGNAKGFAPPKKVFVASSK